MNRHYAIGFDVLKAEGRASSYVLEATGPSLVGADCLTRTDAATDKSTGQPICGALTQLSHLITIGFNFHTMPDFTLNCL